MKLTQKRIPSTILEYRRGEIRLGRRDLGGLAHFLNLRSGRKIECQRSQQREKEALKQVSLGS